MLNPVEMNLKDLVDEYAGSASNAGLELGRLLMDLRRYREALETLGKWAEESLCETPATQHPVLDAGSVLTLINKTLLK